MSSSFRPFSGGIPATTKRPRVDIDAGAADYTPAPVSRPAPKYGVPHDEPTDFMGTLGRIGGHLKTILGAPGEAINAAAQSDFSPPGTKNFPQPIKWAAQGVQTVFAPFSAAPGALALASGAPQAKAGFDANYKTLEGDAPAPYDIPALFRGLGGAGAETSAALGSIAQNPNASWQERLAGSVGAVGLEALPFVMPAPALGRGRAKPRVEVLPRALPEPRAPLALPAGRAIPMTGAIEMPASFRPFSPKATPTSAVTPSFQARVGKLAPVGREDLVGRFAKPSDVPPLSLDDLRARIGARTSIDPNWQEGVPLNAAQLSERIGAKPRVNVPDSLEQRASFAGTKTRPQADMAARTSMEVEARASRPVAESTLTDQLAASLRAKGRPDLVVGEQTAPGTLAAGDLKGRLVARASATNNMNRLAKLREGNVPEGVEGVQASLVRQSKVHQANEAAVAALRAGDMPALERSLRDVVNLGGSLENTRSHLRSAGLPAPTAGELARIAKAPPGAASAKTTKAGAKAPASSFLEDVGGSTTVENALGLGLLRRAFRPFSRSGEPAGAGSYLTRADAERIRAERRGTPTAAPGTAQAASKAPAPSAPVTAPERSIPREAYESMRSLISLIDLPIGRQGIRVIGNPMAFAKGTVAAAHGYKGGPKVVETWLKEKQADPLWKRFVEEGELELTSAESGSVVGKIGREEAFPGGKIEQVPVLGTGIKHSNAAYTHSLNVMRWEKMKGDLKAAEWLWKHLLRRSGPLPLSEVKGIGRNVNVSTGRGQLGWAKAVGNEAGSVFFSPRNTISWPQFFTDWALHLKNGNPVAAALQAKTLVTFMTFAYSFLKAREAAGDEVEWDWRSSDFMKVKDGDQRFDVMGGGQQWIVAFVRLFGGQSKGADGKVTARGFDDVVGPFLSNRSHPGIGNAYRAARLGATTAGRAIEGKPFTGTMKDEYKNETGVLELILGSTTPLILQQFIESIRFEMETDQQYLDAALDTLPGLLGFGGGRYRSGVKLPAMGSPLEIGGLFSDEDNAIRSAMSTIKTASTRAEKVQAIVSLQQSGRLTPEVRKAIEDSWGELYEVQVKPTGGIVDGDTIKLIDPPGLNRVKGQRDSYRLIRVDTPELDEPGGREAKAAIESRLAGARTIEIRTDEVDGNGRYLVELFVDGENLSDWLVAQKLATYNKSSRGDSLNVDDVLRNAPKPKTPTPSPRAATPKPSTTPRRTAGPSGSFRPFSAP